jgi:hypothetical protein
MPNKMKAAGMPAKGKNVKKIGEHGVYGANPSFPEYKQSMGKDTIPTKFAESSIGRTMRRTNPVTSARQTDNLRPSSMSAISGSATVLTGKNRYSSVKGGMMGNKKSGR